MQFKLINKKFHSLIEKISFYFQKKFKKNTNIQYLEKFKNDLNHYSENIFNNCNKLLNFLYDIEEKERGVQKVEINFLVPVHDLIQNIIKKKIDLENHIGSLIEFFQDSVVNCNKLQIENIKNKKNSYQILEKIKLIIFEINELFYESLKFDEIIDILELNQEFIENLSGLDEKNHEIEKAKIFNYNETLIAVYNKILDSTENLQKNLSTKNC